MTEYAITLDLRVGEELVVVENVPATVCESVSKKATFVPSGGP
jgi:hypothetical protein